MEINNNNNNNNNNRVRPIQGKGKTNQPPQNSDSTIYSF